MLVVIQQDAVSGDPTSLPKINVVKDNENVCMMNQLKITYVWEDIGLHHTHSHNQTHTLKEWSYSAFKKEWSACPILSMPSYANYEHRQTYDLMNIGKRMNVSQKNNYRKNVIL